MWLILNYFDCIWLPWYFLQQKCLAINFCNICTFKVLWDLSLWFSSALFVFFLKLHGRFSSYYNCWMEFRTAVYNTIFFSVLQELLMTSQPYEEKNALFRWNKLDPNFVQQIHTKCFYRLYYTLDISRNSLWSCSVFGESRR